MKRSLFFCLFVLNCVCISAQYNTVVHLTNGTNVLYSNSDIDSLTFAKSLEYDELSIEEAKYRWSGKNVLFLGDSFFDGGLLVNQICSVLDCSAINRGVNGSVVASVNNSSFMSLVDRIDGHVDNSQEHYSVLPNTCDAVIINCSTNDWQKSIPLGSVEDGYSIKTTFYGGLHYVIHSLVKKYGNIPIIWIEPTHRVGYGKAEFSMSTDGKMIINTNEQGKTLKDYVNALREVCEIYSIPLVPAYSSSRIQPFWDVNRTSYTLDGLHPNKRGCKLIALKLLETICWLGI